MDRITAVASLERQPPLTNDDHKLASDGQSASETDEEERNGGRKRRRPMNVTCEACKQRKVKCDRAQPSCGWCARNDHGCEYRERKKPGLRAGYGRELENRLDRLEAILDEQGRQLAVHLQASCSLSSSASGLPLNANTINFTSTNSLPNGARGYSPTTVVRPQAIHPDLRTSSATANDDVLRHSASANSEPMELHSHRYHHSPTQPQPQTSPHSDATFQQLSEGHTEIVAPFPPYDLLYSLVDLYFKHINTWFSLLDRKSTFETLFGQSPLAEADKVLLHAIIAAALRFSQDPRLSAESRHHFHTTSKQKVQLFGIENSSVRSLQALVILAFDVTGTTNGPPAWNMLSLISRSVVQLGLAAESSSSVKTPVYPSIATLRAAVLPEPTSCIEDEERRRLFWCIFMLDRYATVATAFEFALDEKEIDRRLPCRDDLFLTNKPIETRWIRKGDRSSYNAVLSDTHGHFAYHSELLIILGRIHQFLKRPVDIGSLSDVRKWQESYRALDGELNAWHFGLPDEFANVIRMTQMNTLAKAQHCGWIMLHAAYCLTVIRLNSSAAYPSQTSKVFSSSYSAMQRCLSAVENLRKIAQLVRNSEMLDKVGPPFAFAAWVAARVTLVHGSIMDHEVDPNTGFFVSMLADLSQYWAVAQRYSDILSRVLEEYRALPTADVAGRVTPSTVKILADMRRCAFDLDFLISRQSSVGNRLLHLPRANSPQPNELEYLDVFDLFNFPRLPVSQDNMGGTAPGGEVGQSPTTEFNLVGNSLAMPNFAIPNPNADWLFHPT